MEPGPCDLASCSASSEAATSAAPVAPSAGWCTTAAETLDLDLADGRQLGDGIAEPEGHDAAGVAGCDDDELVLAEAGHRVEEADAVGDGSGHVAEDLVSDAGALALADVGQAVDIEEDHGKRCPLARGTGDLQLEHALEGDPVGQPGEAVGVQEAVGVVRALPGGVAQAGLADGHGGQVGDGQDRIGSLLEGRLGSEPAHGHEAFEEGAVLVLDDHGQEQAGTCSGQERAEAHGHAGRKDGQTVGHGASKVGVGVGEGHGPLAVHRQERVRVDVVEEDGHGVAVGDGERLGRERLQLALEPAATRHDTRGIKEAERDEAVGHRGSMIVPLAPPAYRMPSMAAASPSNRR